MGKNVDHYQIFIYLERELIIRRDGTTIIHVKLLDFIGGLGGGGKSPPFTDFVNSKFATYFHNFDRLMIIKIC